MFISSAEIVERIAMADAAAAAGIQVEGIRTMVSWGPFHGHFVYRDTATTLYFANEDYAEFYVILEGAGTMTLGSTLTNPVRTGPHLEATSAKGGVPYKVTKGDMLMVPAGTAHRVTEVEGRLVYMSMHLPLQTFGESAQTAPGH